jgi:three-Cys-motif partner protein
LVDDELVLDEAFDRLGVWSQIKHEILGEYAHAYTTIVKKQRFIDKVLYIDAFAGTGYGVDRDTGEQLRGSALRAMAVRPPFDELHFVEQNAIKADVLAHAAKDDSRVTVHRGDGIAITESLLNRAKYTDYRRALCLLDPYGLTVPWSLVERIGHMRSVEIFYNFMIMDANRNVLWTDPSRVPAERLPKMDTIWGDRSWRKDCYEEVSNLFGDTDEKKLPNEKVAEVFRRRLQTVAGFKYVPPPIAMKNSTNAVVYYLYFASPNRVGGHIVEQIFSKYRRRGSA